MNAAINPEQVFRDLADILAHSYHKNFYLTLVERLEEILQVDHVLLARYNKANKEYTSLVMRSEGETQDNVAFELEGSPWEHGVSSETYFYNGDALINFPQWSLLRQLETPSFMAIPILSGRDEQLGVLCIFQKSPITWPEIGREVLRIVAAQVSAEMERALDQLKISELAFQDPLTGLANRARLQQYLKESVANSQYKQRSVGFIIVDLKRFKEINDTYGHHIGDLLLGAVARRLKNLTNPNVFIARQASDEFAFVDTHSSPDKLRTKIARIKAVFEQPFSLLNHEFYVGVNIGASLLPHDSDTASELFQHASIAVDQAKKMGMNECIYDASIAEQLYRKHRVLKRLNIALKDGLFDVYFQPQFLAKTGRLHGAEALCRWTDDELGVVHPSEFIVLAEERGLISEIDQYMLKKVCEYLQVWHVENNQVPEHISVNLSAQHFEHLGVVSKVIEATKPMEAANFVLEITESVMMREPEQALTLINELKSIGFSIAVDDFGTGYSSLSYLQRFASQYLKIDRSFIFDLENNEQNRSIVKAVIAMAQSIGIKTIAEGVETEQQKQILEALGCDILQGFYLGKPCPADVFSKTWLQAPTKNK